MKIDLIYYKNILDIIVSRFINDYNDSFTKINNCYVMSANIDRSQLKKYMSLAIKNFINELYESIGNKYDKLIIIGACYPVNNILLELNTAQFPNNLQTILKSKRDIKYILKEDDILIDIDMFNSVAIEIFNDWFSNDKLHKRMFNNDNIIFISHNNLDCYMIFKSIKWLYGNSNCINIWKNKFNATCDNINAINDLISKYSNNKRMLNSFKKFKTYVNELKNYLNIKLGI